MASTASKWVLLSAKVPGSSIRTGSSKCQSTSGYSLETQMRIYCSLIVSISETSSSGLQQCHERSWASIAKLRFGTDVAEVGHETGKVKLADGEIVASDLVTGKR